ncbi:MAG TPA: 50S ribosomal protein L4 [Clostridia bacterium]|nr:50S ribosomal protein L4 [Clostridia bacterium]
MNLKVFNIDGQEVGAIDVMDEIFNADYNESLIHQVIVAQLANKRQGTKSTLTRTEVRGGGVKPWRQKGTGRARQGSIRSPQWRHGGVVFAPKPRDFSKKINKRMKFQALISVLSQKLRQEELIVLDAIELTEAKTKAMATICTKLDAGKKPMFILGSENVNVVRATNNLEDVEVCYANLINVYDLVRAGKVFFTKDAIAKIEEVAE